MASKTRFAISWTRVPPIFLEAAAVVLLALPMLLPLFVAAAPQTHDALNHVYRTIVLAWHLGHGDLYPRLAADLGYGYGVPVFNFYGPLFYYPPALLILLGADAAAAVNVCLMLMVVLAGWGTLRLGREWFGPAAGWIAAAAFLYSPYFLLDLYWRGAFPEVLGLALLPWGLLFFTRLVRSPLRAGWRANWLGAAASTACVALAHNISIIWSLPLFAASALAGWLLAEPASRPALIRRAGRAALALGLGLALAGFFLLPAVSEIQWIQASRLTGSPQRDYHNNFLPPAELLSLPQVFDPTQIAPLYPRSLGLPQLALAALGLALIWREPRPRRWLWLGLLLAAAASVALTLAPSAPVWDALPPMRFIQFPWRWLGPASLLLALLAGYALGALLPRLRRGRAAAFALAAGVVMAGNLSWAFATFNPPQPGAGIDAVRAFERSSGLVGLSTEGEFLPIWVTQMPPSDSLAGQVTAGDILARIRPETLPAGVQLQSADYQLTTTTARFTASAPAEVSFDWFYFPGWTASVNGQPAPISIDSPSGRIRLSLPAGASEVRLVFGTTPDRVAGGLISLLALLGIVVGAIVLVPRPVPEAGAAIPIAAPPVGRWMALTAAVGLVFTVWRVGWVDRGLTPWLQVRFNDLAVRGAGQALNVPFGDQLALIGWDPPAGAVPAGDSAPVNLYWRALQPLSHDYSIAFHVLDEQGRLITQADSQHPGGTPTSIWPLDRYDLDPHTIHVPAGTPPGAYRILVGVYHIENGDRLTPLSDAGLPLPDRLYALGTLQVSRPRQAPSPADLGIQHEFNATFGPIRLIGLDLGLASVRPGDDLPLASYWQSTQTPGGDDQARYVLTDAAGASFTFDTPPVIPSYPTHLWAPQETLRGANSLRVPAAAAPGQASLTLTLVDPSGAPLGPAVPVGQVAIEPVSRSFVALHPALPLGASLGGAIELDGTSAVAASIRPGDVISVTLDWHVLGPVAERYTVFVHLLDASGALRAQVDAPPLGGARPTSSWLPGEYLSDPYQVTTPADLPPGTYQLEAGLYLPDTGERLAVAGAAAGLGGDSVLLGSVTVSE